MIAEPFIYEINTWPWLERLGTDLAGVPGQVWDTIADAGFDAVWLMGVWQRSPAGAAIARADDGVMRSLDKAVDGVTVDDVVGSAYCIGDYRVDDHLGGPEGLAVARAALAQRGLSLILDFVPNHVAPDHPWIAEHPEYFITGTADDLRDAPESFIDIGGTIVANGRDPYFPAWRDVLQLNTFAPELREQAVATLISIADQCDGVRCDMAMLPLREVVVRTWGERAGPVPADEYWRSTIAAVRTVHPDFTFIAEAYWALESQLQDEGFDHCYDKGLYDALVETGSIDAIRDQLRAGLGYQRGLLRFLENHDEPRAATVFAAAKHRVAAVVVTTLPGATLFYDGQMSGARRHVPVQLGRGPDEVVDDDLAEFYRTLMNTLQDKGLRAGRWQLCQSADDLLAWTREGDNRWLVVVNLSADSAAGTVATGWADLRGGKVRLIDSTRDQEYLRSGDDVCDGLSVVLDPWQWHLFRLELVTPA